MRNFEVTRREALSSSSCRRPETLLHPWIQIMLHTTRCSLQFLYSRVLPEEVITNCHKWGAKEAFGWDGRALP